MSAVSFRSFFSLTVLLPESFLFLFFLGLTSLSLSLVSVRIQRKQLDNTAARPSSDSYNCLSFLLLRCFLSIRGKDLDACFADCG